MTELELRHLRREKWRLEGEPIRTIEEAREFVDSVGMCLMYPTLPLPLPLPLLPTFIGAIAGSDQKLPTRKTALNDPRGIQTEELLARLAREKSVYEAQLHGETLVLSAQVFPYFYALASDRKPKQPIVSRTRPLSQHLFRKLEERGPLSRAQLQEQLGGALSEAALDRTLRELWTALKVTRVDHRSDGGDRWDVYYRWAPEAVNEGVRLSDAEALSALISKYLDCVVAATQDEIETFFSAITSRTRVAEVVRSLLSAREFTYTPSETRTLITVAHNIARPESPRAQVDGRGAPLAPRRRNG